MHSRVLAGEPKTTNHLEAWHRQFSLIIQKKNHPNIYEFISKLKQEQSFTDMKIQQILAGGEPTKPTKKQLAINKRIHNIVTKYSEYNCKMTYLR